MRIPAAGYSRARTSERGAAYELVGRACGSDPLSNGSSRAREGACELARLPHKSSFSYRLPPAARNRMESRQNGA